MGGGDNNSGGQGVGREYEVAGFAGRGGECKEGMGEERGVG